MKENETMLGMPASGALGTTWSWPEVPCPGHSGGGLRRLRIQSVRSVAALLTFFFFIVVKYT